MTKEELYERVLDTKYDLKEELDRFFETNVCIQKGENRHPYADVLHEWVEGADLYGLNNFKVIPVEDMFPSKLYINKSQEPVYEYCYVTRKRNTELLITGYLTDEEVDKVKSEIPNEYLCEYIKLELTKRVRQ